MKFEKPFHIKLQPYFKIDTKLQRLVPLLILSYYSMRCNISAMITHDDPPGKYIYIAEYIIVRHNLIHRCKASLIIYLSIVLRNVKYMNTTTYENVVITTYENVVTQLVKMLLHMLLWNENPCFTFVYQCVSV